MTTADVSAPRWEPTTLLSQPQLLPITSSVPWPNSAVLRYRAAQRDVQHLVSIDVCHGTRACRLPNAAHRTCSLSTQLSALSCRYEHEKGSTDSQGSPHPP